MVLWNAVLWLVYYGVSEGIWGASAGKRICRLRVTRLDRTRPGLPRSFLRAFILTNIPVLVWLAGWLNTPVAVTEPSFFLWATFASFASLLTRGLIFATARRHNGFAGIHDLASGTRVVFRSEYQTRPALGLPAEVLPKVETLPLLGPYHVLDRLGSADGTELLLGFDARLLRRVWIRKLPSGAPDVPAHLRQLARPGRLRWLTGQRSKNEAWDAYEGLSGQPLLALLSERQPWSRVRFWVLDLAEELSAATQEGSMPNCLSLNRVWITAAGRAKLLDFAAPEPRLSRVIPPPALVTPRHPHS
jgi:uncharacterized RDD family membrane protein YckC